MVRISMVLDDFVYEEIMKKRTRGFTKSERLRALILRGLLSEAKSSSEANLYNEAFGSFATA